MALLHSVRSSTSCTVPTVPSKATAPRNPQYQYQIGDCRNRPIVSFALARFLRISSIFVIALFCPTICCGVNMIITESKVISGTPAGDRCTLDSVSNERAI
ncbi:hypothetical protein PM082_003460 [Marasmius tenuissimus]|nr:hypothetical protein PM082_003460 [Marasmius tenuissimus]